MLDILFNSGGLGSFVTGLRLRDGAARPRLHLFTDTLFEDADLYRFLVESVAYMEGYNTPAEALRLGRGIPEVPDEPGPGGRYYAEWEVARRRAILRMREASTGLRRLWWVTDGLDVWQVYEQQRMMGSSRLDPCSKILKREPARRMIEVDHPPDSCVLYFGIGYTERHRFLGGRGKLGVRHHWRPWESRAPLTDEPLTNRAALVKECERAGIDPPRLYDEGFPHNNCGGFCCKGGHTHFAHLLATRPALFRYSEWKETRFREWIDDDVSLMREEVRRVRKPLSLAVFREQVQAGTRTPPPFDWGKGCECFVSPETGDTPG